MYGNKNLCASGLVVKFSLAKAVPRVRFPASAFFCQSIIINSQEEVREQLCLCASGSESLFALCPFSRTVFNFFREIPSRSFDCTVQIYQRPQSS